jgi:hypothetical protein
MMEREVMPMQTDFAVEASACVMTESGVLQEDLGERVGEDVDVDVVVSAERIIRRSSSQAAIKSLTCKMLG